MMLITHEVKKILKLSQEVKMYNMVDQDQVILLNQAKESRFMIISDILTTL